MTFPERPLWLLPEPKPLQMSSMPKIISGPERIESGWWDGGDVVRDYYVARDPQGSLLWVYRQRAGEGAAGSRWFLHGVFG